MNERLMCVNEWIAINWINDRVKECVVVNEWVSAWVKEWMNVWMNE